MQRLSGSWEDNTTTATNDSVWEIEEEELGGASERRLGIPGSPSRATADGECVYVAVGKKSSSMDALAWALNHAATPSSIVYLVHVFPEVHHIPTPCKFPKDQLSSQQVETYMSQERTKRREILQKFINLCQSYKVQVDTLLIESDLIVKAVVDLILVLNIKSLIVGTTKSDRRRLKGSSKAEQIQKTAPKHCEVKIICGGKEVVSTSPSDSTNGKYIGDARRQINKNSISCNCFSRKLK